MGIVYLAREVHLDRLVAIKLLPLERAADSTLRERFLREARLAAKLSHPNIIPIHAVDETGDFVFFVMAYVDGETLAQRVRARGPLPPTDGVRILREVAWALAYAHEQGIVHRDVKPDNILLERATNRVLVADFGIAGAIGDDVSEGVSGTPEFMSPEQALGKQLDGRSDLYCLGATAYFAFSGRLPFEGKTATEILAKHVTEQPPALGAVGIAVPRKVALLVDRCLSKDPEHRPTTAQALAEQLSVALEHRRELPAALRAFVKRGGRLNGAGSVLAGMALLPVSSFAAYMLGDFAGFATFALGITAAPFGYLVLAARRLMLRGFSHVDVAPAFKAELDQAREELLADQRRGPTRLETALRRGAKIGAVTAVAGIATFASLLALPSDVWRDLWRANPGLMRIFWDSLGVLIPAAGSVAIFSTLGLVASMQRHRDVDTDFWSRVWSGRIGRTAFALARKLLGRQAPQLAMTHRATELSLGLAAEQLFDSLPRETRQALGNLPEVLHRLQQDAQALRKHYEDLQEALSDAGDAASSSAYAEIRATRDTIHAKLGETVGALETIRLNLMRLHAGSATVEGVTTHLGLAADVSDEVQRLIAAYQSMERAVEFPRGAAATPA